VELVAVCAAAGLAVPGGTLQLHERLRVRHGAAEHTVPFWVTPDGTVHASDPVRAALLLHSRAFEASLEIGMERSCGGIGHQKTVPAVP
jgi:hypothetical protein